MDVLKFLNKKALFGLILAMPFFLVQGILGSALAEKVDTDSILKRLEIVEKTAGEDSLAKKLGLSLYGFVDTSYTQNFNNPASGANGLRIFDVDSNSFRPHLAQIVLERVGRADGSMEDRAGFRIKLNYGEDAQLTSGSILGNVPVATTGGSATDFDSGDDFDFQEAYGQFIVPIGSGLNVQVGKMNTLIGYEVIESPLNPNFSRSWLFGFGEPFTTTGLRGSYDFTDMVSLSIGVINSFTGTQSDANSSKSIETLLSLSPTDNLGVSIFGFWGPEGARGLKDSERVMIGGIVDLQATDSTELVLEAYYGNHANPTGAGTPNARWNGIAGYVIHDFTDQWSIRFRGELFEDTTGLFTGVAGGTNLWEGTATLQYNPVPSVITRLEFRYDKSDDTAPFFEGVTASNNQQTLAAEAIFLF